MALVDVQETWSDDDHGVEIGDGANTQFLVSKRKFTVLYDAGADRPFNAVYAAGIPALQDGHPSDDDMQCYRKYGRALGPLLFEVVCEYAGRTTPLTEPYDRSWGSADSAEPIDRDYNGDAIRNSLGDPFIGLTVDVGDPVYIVTRNEAVYPVVWAREYQNSVNNAAFMGWNAYTARLLPITGQRIVDKLVYYWKCTYRIQFRMDTWKLRVLNEGMRFWTGYSPGGVPQIGNVTDDNRQMTSGPRKLRLNGTLLGIAEADVWLEFDMYRPRNFTLLGLL